VVGLGNLKLKTRPEGFRKKMPAAHLTVVSVSGTLGTPICLGQKPVTFGLDETNDVRIQRKDVSNVQCKVDFTNQGLGVLENLSAAHPTLLNGEIVRSKRDLYDGDTITIGGRSFRWTYPEGSRLSTMKRSKGGVMENGISRASTLIQQSRKSVSFGPELSPEQFDQALPPSVPVKRGAKPLHGASAQSSPCQGSSPLRLTPTPMKGSQAIHIQGQETTPASGGEGGIREKFRQGWSSLLSSSVPGKQNVKCFYGQNGSDKPKPGLARSMKRVSTVSPLAGLQQKTAAALKASVSTPSEQSCVMPLKRAELAEVNASFTTGKELLAATSKIPKPIMVKTGSPPMSMNGSKMVSSQRLRSPRFQKNLKSSTLGKSLVNSGMTPEQKSTTPSNATAQSEKFTSVGEPGSTVTGKSTKLSPQLPRTAKMQSPTSSGTMTKSPKVRGSPIETGDSLGTTSPSVPAVKSALDKTLSASKKKTNVPSLMPSEEPLSREVAKTPEHLPSPLIPLPRSAKKLSLSSSFDTSELLPTPLIPLPSSISHSPRKQALPSMTASTSKSVKKVVTATSKASITGEGTPANAKMKNQPLPPTSGGSGSPSPTRRMSASSRSFSKTPAHSSGLSSSKKSRISTLAATDEGTPSSTKTKKESLTPSLSGPEDSPSPKRRVSASSRSFSKTPAHSSGLSSSKKSRISTLAATDEGTPSSTKTKKESLTPSLSGPEDSPSPKRRVSASSRSFSKTPARHSGLSTSKSQASIGTKSSRKRKSVPVLAKSSRKHMSVPVGSARKSVSVPKRSSWIVTSVTTENSLPFKSKKSTPVQKSSDHGILAAHDDAGTSILLNSTVKKASKTPKSHKKSTVKKSTAKKGMLSIVKSGVKSGRVSKKVASTKKMLFADVLKQNLHKGFKHSTARRQLVQPSKMVPLKKRVALKKLTGSVKKKTTRHGAVGSTGHALSPPDIVIGRVDTRKKQSSTPHSIRRQKSTSNPVREPLVSGKSQSGTPQSAKKGLRKSSIMGMESLELSGTFPVAPTPSPKMSTPASRRRESPAKMGTPNIKSALQGVRGKSHSRSKSLVLARRSSVKQLKQKTRNSTITLIPQSSSRGSVELTPASRSFAKTPSSGDATTFDFSAAESPNITTDIFVSPINVSSQSSPYKSRRSVERRKTLTPKVLSSSKKQTVSMHTWEKPVNPRIFELKSGGPSSVKKTKSVKRKKSARISGVKKLFQRSPEADYSSYVDGIGRLMRNDNKSPLADYDTYVGAVRHLKHFGKGSPKPGYSQVGGVKKLMGSPKLQKSPKSDYSDVQGIRRLMTQQRTPPVDYSNVEGIEALMRSPRTGLQVDKVKESQAFGQSPDLSGIRTWMKTPRENTSRRSSQVVDEVAELIRKPLRKRVKEASPSEEDDMRGSAKRSRGAEEAKLVTPQPNPGSSEPKKARGRRGKAPEPSPVSEPKKGGRRTRAKAADGSLSLESQHILHPTSTQGTKNTRGKRSRANASAPAEITRVGSSRAKRTSPKKAADASESPLAEMKESKMAKIIELPPVSKPPERIRKTRGKTVDAIVTESSDAGKEVPTLTRGRRPVRAASADALLVAPMQEKTRARGKRGQVKTSDTADNAEAESSQVKKTRQKKVTEVSEMHETKTAQSKPSVSESPKSKPSKRGGTTRGKAVSATVQEPSETGKGAPTLTRNKTLKESTDASISNQETKSTRQKKGKPAASDVGNDGAPSAGKQQSRRGKAVISVDVAPPLAGRQQSRRGKAVVSETVNDEAAQSAGKQKSRRGKAASVSLDSKEESTDTSQPQKGKKATRKRKQKTASGEGDDEVFSIKNKIAKEEVPSSPPKAQKGRTVRARKAGQVPEEDKSSLQQQGKAATHRGRGKAEEKLGGKPVQSKSPVKSPPKRVTRTRKNHP
ncbi:unnamed protein product, partial [Darwinula stevensoni]